MNDGQEAALERPVPWDEITGRADVPDGEMRFGEQWVSYGQQGLRGYKGEIYAECENGGWMALKSWIKAIASGDLDG